MCLIRLCRWGICGNAYSSLYMPHCLNIISSFVQVIIIHVSIRIYKCHILCGLNILREKIFEHLADFWATEIFMLENLLCSTILYYSYLFCGICNTMLKSESFLSKHLGYTVLISDTIGDMTIYGVIKSAVCFVTW